MDSKRREYDIVVIGEESHLAYNRVGLTSFFQHRKVENLYLNPHDWVCSCNIYVDLHLDLTLIHMNYLRSIPTLPLEL